MISPPRAAYPHPPQLQPVRPPLPHQRVRSTVALPPIETVLSQTPVKTASVSSQSSGVEAMIMSIPVLNKVKVLSQISGPLPGPSLTSPRPEVRGAIIAIEGMDTASVNSMTSCLAEQLGKDGNFAVKIFDGPDPHSLIREARRGGQALRGNVTTEIYLQMLSEWHKINKEMVEYITTRPDQHAGTGSKAGSSSLHGHSLDKEPATPGRTTDSDSRRALLEGQTTSTTDVPLSAISPKTIHKAAELSIVSPPPATRSRSQSTLGPKADDQDDDDMVQTENKSASRYDMRPASLTFPRPLNSNRIPPPPPLTPSTAQPPPQTRAFSRVPPTNHSDQVQESAQATKNPQAQAQDNENNTSLQQSNASTAIPIALVPHFQLTTVDASSISMPISDGFSPPAHWQWFATLWRGSVGPDVTIVIKSTDEEVVEGAGTDAGTRNAATGGTNIASGPPTNSNPAPGQSQMGRERTSGSTAGLVVGMSASAALSTTSSTSTSASGVEIRLNDCRAVVVKTGIISSSTGGSGTDPSSKQVSLKELEYWEKAKRRVGFEVEEFLRR